MSGDPLGILTPKKSFASNDPLGILSTPKKEQPAIPGFMDIGGQTQQTIQTAQQKVPKVQQQPIAKPKQETGIFDVSVIGQEVKPTAPVNKGGLPIGVAVGKDKKKEGSTLGGIYNTLVGSFARFGGGLAQLGTDLVNLKTGMPYIPGKGVRPIYDSEENRAATEGFIEKARTVKSTKQQEQARSNFDLTDGISASDVEALAFQAPSQLLDLTLGALSYGSSFFIQAINDNAKELEQNPNADKLSEQGKLGYVYLQASAQSALDAIGLGGILKGTGLNKLVTKKIANEITDELVAKGGKATAKQIQDLAIKKASQLSSKIKRVGLGTATGFALEGGTEGAQEAAQKGIKLLTNKLAGQEIFDEQDIRTNFVKDVINNAAAGGVFGSAFGTGTAALNNTNKSIRRQIAQANKPEDLQRIADDINTQIEQGNLTPQEGEQALQKAQQYTEIATKIPAEIDEETKYDVIGGIDQRNGLQAEIDRINEELKSVDPAFAKQKQDQLALLQDKLAEVNDYIQVLVTGEKPKYAERNGKYFKIDPATDEETEITKGHYELANAADLNIDNPQKRGEPEEISQPIELQVPDEIQETQVIQPKANEGTITESESIERRLPESEREVEPITTETESIAETKPIEPIQEEVDKVKQEWDNRVSQIDIEKEYTDLNELKVGDVILTKNGGIGFVKKISPKNVLYETTYNKNGETVLMELKTSKADIQVFKKPKAQPIEQPEQQTQQPTVSGKEGYDVKKIINGLSNSSEIRRNAPEKRQILIDNGYSEIDLTPLSYDERVNVMQKILDSDEEPIIYRKDGTEISTNRRNFALGAKDLPYTVLTKEKNIVPKEVKKQQPTISETKPIQEEVSITTEPEIQPQEPIIAETKETTIKEQQGKVDTGAKKDLSTKAREYAAKLRSGEETVLPDWLQANLPKGTKKQGISINEAFAKALETFADIYDTTKNFAQAVDEGFQKIKDWFEENKIPYNEAELKEKFAQDRQGEIPSESEPSPPSEPPISEQGEGKGFRHADTEKIRERSGLEPYQRIPETIQGWIDEARKRIKDGYDVEALLNRVEKGIMPDAVEQNIIGEYLMYLDEQVKANPSDENIAKLKRVVEISDKVGGSEIAKSLVARRGSRLPDDSLGNFFIQQMEATGANVLTENQKQVNTKEFEEIQAANNEYKEKVKILEEEVAKLKAQKEIDEVKRKSQPSKTKKTHEDYVKERKDIIKQMREDLLKVAKGSGGLQSSIPGAAQLKAIAPHVGKLVKSLVDENYTKLEDIVKLVYNEIKDIVEGITEKDIQNIIAGDYSEKKQTRANLAATLRDLKTEAKLLGELEKLQNGVEPKVERQKQIRNKRITDLQNQIKEIRKQQYVREKEFNKFYTEDLDAEFKKLSALRKRTETEIAKVEEKIKKGDFAPEERKPLLLNPELKKKYPEEFKKAVEAKDKLIKLKQEREIRLLKEKYANRTKYQKIQDAVVEVSNVPRAIMASVDFSAPLRQGIITTVAYPTISMKAIGEMFKQAFSQKAFDRWFYDVKEHPRYELAKKSTLHLADPHDPKLSAKEEQFMSNLAEKIPVIGRLVKGSERAYIAFLNKVRWDVFNRMADAYEAEGKTFENSEKLYRETGDYINTVTGRGTLGKFDESAQVLNAVFFSPRLIASRVKLLTNFANPNFYYNVPKEVRVQYFKDMAKFLGAGLSVLTLAKLYQEAFGSDEEDEKVTVEVDPRSSDFGKIKVGNTRYDIWGGFQPYVRLMAQMFTGQRKTTTTGEIQNLQPKQKIQTASNFFRGKLAPVPASGVDIITGENVTGDRVQPLEELTSMLIPLTFQDLSEAIKDKGVSAIFTTGIPSTFGVGTQTYTNTSTLEGLYDRNLTSKQTMDINKITKYENGVEKPITKDEFKKFTQKRDSLIKSELDELYKNGKVYVKDGKPIKKAFADMTPVEVQDEIKKIKTNATKQAKEELFPVPLNIQIKEDIDQSLQEILNK